MTDKIVEAVREDLLRRSQRGLLKYGVTLERDDLSLKEWLQHAYEETLDKANYLKRTIMMLEDFVCAYPEHRCTAQCENCKEAEDERKKS